jgi:hypothetical protein
MEALTRLGESRSLAAGDLAAANDQVDIERIEPRQTRLVDSAAMRVDPEPRKGSSTMSPRLERSRSASFNMQGLTPPPAD